MASLPVRQGIAGLALSSSESHALIADFQNKNCVSKLQIHKYKQNMYIHTPMYPIYDYFIFVLLS